MTTPPDNPMKAHRYCGAKTRSGGSCKRAPVENKRRCKLHGGDNPGRPIIHGLYRRHIPVDDQATYDAIDPRDVTEPAKAARYLLDMTIKLAASGDAAAIALADKMLGRVAGLEQVKIAQEAAAAAAAAPDATRQLIIAPPVAKSADEWVENYKPDAD